MGAKKTIVDVMRNSNGNVVAVKFDGNSTYTAADVAIRIADTVGIKNVHAVHPRSRSPYLRSNPDSNLVNNLDNMGN